MDEPKISIIVPIYNVEQYLCKCVDSIIAQTYCNLEIILVDDGSPDACPAICDEYAAKDARIKVIHKKNGGLGDARNAGLDAATGDYIAFVDSDDWIEPSMYEEMLCFMQSKHLDVVFCAANVVENGKIVEVRGQYYADCSVCSTDEVIRQSLIDCVEAYFPLKLFHRRCFEGVRFPTNRLFEDVAVSFEPFVRAKQPIGFLNKPLYNYVKNPNGLSYHRKPLTLYHLYLGNLEHYRYTKAHYPDLLPQCTALTARFALGTYLDCYCCGYQEPKPYVAETERFLEENRGILDHDQYMTKAWRAGLRLYYFSKLLFRICYRIFISIRKKGEPNG